MKNFISIQPPSSPINVTQNLSIDFYKVFEFEFFRVEMINKFLNFLEVTHDDFFNLFKHLYYLQQLDRHYQSGRIAELLYYNQHVVQKIIMQDLNILQIVRSLQVHLHPDVTRYLSQMDASAIDHLSLMNILYLTQKYIADLQKIKTEVDYTRTEYRNMKLRLKVYIKMHQALYASMAENERLLVETSQDLIIDEERQAYIDQMKYHHSLTDENKEVLFAKHHETCDDEDYGQFVDTDTDDSLIVYISKSNDSSEGYLSKFDAQNEINEILTSHSKSKYHFFFDKDAFAFRAASGFLNEHLHQHEKGIVYQF